MRPSTQDRYLIISSDTHAGADLRGYKPYLEKKFQDDFDDWADATEQSQLQMREMLKAGGLESPVNIGIDGDLEADGDRNWNLDRRLRELEVEGIIGQVVFPNTLPPFAPPMATQMEAPKLTADDMERRWAGLRAHNRWAAEFASQAPTRVAPVTQIFLGDVEGSVREIEWAHANGLRGGVLLPGAPPGSGFAPLYAPDYEPIWATCAELGMAVNHHSGGGTPDFGPYFPASMAMFMLEVTWWAHRAMWHLLFSGVFHRHPTLQFVNTETGTAWIVDTLRELDSFYDRMKYGNFSEAIFGGIAVKDMDLRPSEYWQRQCHVGASFLRPIEAALRHQVGVGNIAWGSDYPHVEGTQPYTSLYLRRAFAGVDETEVQQMLALNSARLYHFDVDALWPLAEQFGPLRSEVATPLPYDQVPEAAHKCPGLAPANQLSEV